jgi:biotin carboxylase
MKNNRLLMCMPYRQLVHKAAAAGFRVFSIWDPALESAEYLADVAEFSAEMVLTDFGDQEELRRLVAETAARHDPAHVLHLGSEATQLAVCEQAEVMGLALNSPCSLAQINDKAAMRALLTARGISPVISIEAGSAFEAEQILRERAELPVVVKPTRLDGSRAVRLIERPGDIDGWREELAGLDYRESVLIEEYLRGPEFSVETITAHGVHHVVGITAKRLGRPPHFVEMGHVHPAPLPGEARAAISELVVTYLEATGYRFGPAHTEVILTGAGPRIVESQARLGGDRIPLLVELASGFDMEAAVFTALAGRPVEPAPAQRFAAISFFDFGTGYVRAIQGADDIGRLPYVHALKLKVAPGDALAPVRSSSTRHGYAVVTAATQRQADERLADVRARLSVVTSPDGELPASAGRHHMHSPTTAKTKD